MLVPHTHWDREWYEPFQVFRFKLVEMFDEVIERAETDSEFRFTLDGQTAAIEDYQTRKVPYRYINVKKDRAELDHMLTLTGGRRQVPVIVEAGHVTIGFGGT